MQGVRREIIEAGAYIHILETVDDFGNLAQQNLGPVSAGNHRDFREVRAPVGLPPGLQADIPCTGLDGAGGKIQ